VGFNWPQVKNVYILPIFPIYFLIFIQNFFATMFALGNGDFTKRVGTGTHP
jgi:hypothetical protein